jgi:hypothetical protein
VVEDREPGVPLGLGVGGHVGAVVARQRVRVAHEDRVAGRELSGKVQLGADRAADLQLQVAKAVERRRHEAVALEPSERLAFELGRLADEGVERRARQRLERPALRAEGDPRLAHVHGVVGARGVAVVQVQEADLDVPRDRARHVQVQVHERTAHLERGAGRDRLERDVRLAHGHELGRKRKREREAVVLGPTAVHLQFGGYAELEAVLRFGLGLARGGRGRLLSVAGRSEGQGAKHVDRDSLHALPSPRALRSKC